MTGRAGLIATKLWSMWFHLRYGGRFEELGAKAFLFRPFRVDGMHNIRIGRESSVQRGGWLYCLAHEEGASASLRIGSGCSLGYNNHITCVREVTIGSRVLTANNVYVSDNIHSYENVTLPIMDQPVKFKGAVSIGDGSWIGENACIIGASVGKNSVIGANAVVTRDIPDFCVAVGNPAAVIRRYDVAAGVWARVSSSAGSGFSR